MFDDALHFLVQAQEDPNWARLGQHLPYEWIEHAVAYTGKASIRQRRLPAEQLVWLVVALALYRHQSISEVVDDLDLALPDAQAPFGAQVYPGGRISSYPQVRGVTLTAVPTHLVRDAKFGPYGVNEMLYAKELLASIPDDSLTALDKGFLSAEILCGLTRGGINRHFIIPAKANTKWEVVGGTPDDAVIEMRVSPQARKKCPDLVMLLNEERPGRKIDRAVKALPQRYAVRVLKKDLN